MAMLHVIQIICIPISESIEKLKNIKPIKYLFIYAIAKFRLFNFDYDNMKSPVIVKLTQMSLIYI
jgi:hypothetical protein